MNKKGVKMQEKNVQGKKKQEKKVQGNRSQENRIQGKEISYMSEYAEIVIGKLSLCWFRNYLDGEIVRLFF